MTSNMVANAAACAASAKKIGGNEPVMPFENMLGFFTRPDLFAGLLDG